MLTCYSNLKQFMEIILFLHAEVKFWPYPKAETFFSLESFVFSKGCIADNLELNVVTWTTVFKDSSYTGFKNHVQN